MEQNINVEREEVSFTTEHRSMKTFKKEKIRQKKNIIVEELQNMVFRDYHGIVQSRGQNV